MKIDTPTSSPTQNACSVDSDLYVSTFLRQYFTALMFTVFLLRTNKVQYRSIENTTRTAESIIPLTHTVPEKNTMAPTVFLLHWDRKTISTHIKGGKEDTSPEPGKLFPASVHFFQCSAWLMHACSFYAFLVSFSIHENVGCCTDANCLVLVWPGLHNVAVRDLVRNVM